MRGAGRSLRLRNLTKSDPGLTRYAPLQAGGGGFKRSAHSADPKTLYCFRKPYIKRAKLFGAIVEEKSEEESTGPKRSLSRLSEVSSRRTLWI